MYCILLRSSWNRHGINLGWTANKMKSTSLPLTNDFLRPDKCTATSSSSGIKMYNLSVLVSPKVTGGVILCLPCYKSSCKAINHPWSWVSQFFTNNLAHNQCMMTFYFFSEGNFALCLFNKKRIIKPAAGPDLFQQFVTHDWPSISC